MSTQTATLTTLHTYGVQVAQPGARGCLATIVVLAQSPAHAQVRAVARYLALGLPFTPDAVEARRVTRRSPKSRGE